MLTIVIITALAGYALGFRTSRRYHRRVLIRTIEQQLREGAE